MNAHLSLIADSFFPRLKALVIDTTGMAFYADKDDDLARIVGERMAEVGVGGCARYLELLEDPRRGKDEMDALVAELTIGETYFFRHKEQFVALRERILPDVIERNADVRRIRIWSAGCATGPEPYSLAIMLKREFGMRIAGWHISIVGTDINQKFLARARDGRYEEWAFRATPDDIRAECFERSGKHWLIRPEYKAWVSFQYHNLIANRFPSILDNIAGFDIIICRNVVIYFSRETVERLVPCFRDTLVDGGWLVMGHAEPNMELFRSFHTVNVPGAVLYQRLDKPQATAVAAPAPPPPAVPVRPSPAFRTALAPKRSFPRPTAPVPVPVPVPATGRLAEVRRLADGGRWNEALKLLDPLIQAESLDPKLHFYRALILEQLGDLEESEKALKRCIYLDRHFVLPHYHLGLFHSRRNEADAAQRSFRNVLALLDRFPDDHAFLDGDDVTAGQLREAVGMHLKLIGPR
ncbi:MAG: CheR family methyltransferase [Pseudomonadota bacterium]